jgi:hypothetical protein
MSRCQLPISDYDNDTRTVVEQIPRLLAAVEYIFLNEYSSYCDGFVMATFYRTFKQIFQTRSMVSSTVEE